MATEIVEYSKTEAALAVLAQQYQGVIYDVTTKEGMDAARKGRAEIKGYRVALEKTRKEIKESALRRCQVIDAEARRITSALEALEDPIDEQIKREEKRIEDERRAAEEKARKEREAEEARLREIKRQKAELLDGKALLETFVKRFGHRPEFRKVSDAISTFLVREAA